MINESIAEWQDLCESTFQKFPTLEEEIFYLKGKLFAETGELVGQLFGWRFHQDEKKKAKLLSEAGDVCWYIFNLARRYGILDCIYVDKSIANQPAYSVHLITGELLDCLAWSINIDLPSSDMCAYLSAILSRIILICRCEKLGDLAEIEAVNRTKIMARSGGTGVYNNEKFKSEARE